MAITIKPFENHTLVELSSKVKEAQTFLLDKVLTGQEYVASRKIDLANYYGAHRIAMYRDVYLEAAQIPSIERRGSTIEVARFAIMREIHAADVLYSSVNMFGDASPASVSQAFSKTTAESLTDLVNRLYRAIEYMLGAMISNASGTVTFDNGAARSIGNLTVHTTDVNWGVATTDVIKCVSDMKRKVLLSIGNVANVRFIGLFNNTVGQWLRANTSYKNYFALTYNGEISIPTPQEYAQYKYVKYMGNIEGVDMIQYDDVYVALTETNDGVVTPIIPDNRFILIGVLPENKLYYTHAPNTEAFAQKRLVYVKQESEFMKGKEVIRMIAETNPFPFVEKDAVCIATITNTP